MRQIKYFSSTFEKIESEINQWISDNQMKINQIYKVHINQEIEVEGVFCVNGFIDYESINS